MNRISSSFLSVLAAAGALCGQEPSPAATDQSAAAAQALLRAFVEPDGDRRITIAAAASAVHCSGAAGRAAFVARVRAILAVAPKDGEVAAGDGAGPIVFAAPILDWMHDVVVGQPAAVTAALAKLTADREGGAAALGRLRERGETVLARCIVAHVQEKLATNAIYAGQFDELRDYQPEAAGLLLECAARPQRHAPNTVAFRTACVRALRDVLPGERGDDATRAELRGILANAQAGGHELLFVTAACALHQYGDPEPFDRLKAAVAENAANAQSPEHLNALNTLAELHYQLRQFAAAAAHFGALLDASEKAGRPLERIVTLTYNLACSLTLAGQTDEALPVLDKALAMAAKGRLLSKVLVDEDHDLDGLRADPRFVELMRRHFGTLDSHGR